MLYEQKGLQTLIHNIEQGKFAPIARATAGIVLLITVTLLYLFVQFRGLATPDAMDQAQIARAIASGEGVSTRYVRPLALWQFNRAGKVIPAETLPDISQPPLHPLFNAVPLLIVKGSWAMSPKDITYIGDRAIALMAILFFLASAFVAYRIALRLFDKTLAGIAIVSVLVTDLLWQFSLSGMAHMLTLLLFSLACYAILHAMGKQEDQSGRLPAPLAHALIGLLFGLMTLSHWLACWLFFGYLFFAFVYFRQRLLPLLTIAAFLLVITPWLVRNHMVCGHPFGLALYPIGAGVETRSLQPDFSKLFYGFFLRMRLGILSQMQNLFSFLGLNLAAGAFFVSLLHPFKRIETSRFRWCILAMWVCAVLGAAAYGAPTEAVATNQIQVLFIPLMATYGLAFLLVLWHRLGIHVPLFRYAFISILVILCAVPMLLTLFAGQSARVHWPPYIPPFIGALGQLYGENEGLCSDMPWAVAWYAHRKCLLLPETPKTMVEISDYNIMGVPIRGLYLTPVSGDKPYLAEILRGEYKQWMPFILRITGPPRDFPLSVPLALGMEGQLFLYSDRDRWSRTTTEP
jgi:hypothetical protein